MAHNFLSMHFRTFNINNIKVTVNTCTCTDLFTIISTKNQSGGIYNSYSTGGQEFMAVSKHTSSLGFILGLCLWTRSVYCLALCFCQPHPKHVQITYAM